MTIDLSTLKPGDRVAAEVVPHICASLTIQERDVGVVRSLGIRIISIIPAPQAKTPLGGNNNE